MNEDLNQSPSPLGVDGEAPASTEMQFVSGESSAIDAASGGFPEANYTAPDGRRIHVDPSGQETPTAWHPVPGEFGGPPSIGPETHTEAEHEAGREAAEEREKRMEWLHHTHDPHTEEEREPKPEYNPEIPNNEAPPY
jgi:hypothetical protein